VFCEHQWAFLAPIWHKTCGSQVFLWQFHTKPLNKTWGNSSESSEIVNRRRSWTTLSTCCTWSSVTRDGHPWPPSSCTSVLPSQNFLHHSLTHLSLKVWSIHYTHSAMNFSCTMAFSLQKTDHCANFTLAGSFCSSTHVNMLIAQWELNAMPGRVVWDEAIVCRSVLCQCQVAIFTGLPTLAHRTLISRIRLVLHFAVCYSCVNNTVVDLLNEYWKIHTL
jgi:hypothetical protein